MKIGYVYKMEKCPWGCKKPNIVWDCVRYYMCANCGKYTGIKGLTEEKLFGKNLEKIGIR